MSDTPESAYVAGRAAFRRGHQTTDNPWLGAKDEDGKQLSRAWLDEFSDFYAALSKAKGA